MEDALDQFVTDGSEQELEQNGSADFGSDQNDEIVLEDETIAVVVEDENEKEETEGNEDEEQETFEVEVEVELEERQEEQEVQEETVEEVAEDDEEDEEEEEEEDEEDELNQEEDEDNVGDEDNAGDAEETEEKPVGEENEGEAYAEAEAEVEADEEKQDNAEVGDETGAEEKKPNEDVEDEKKEEEINQHVDHEDVAAADAKHNEHVAKQGEEVKGETGEHKSAEQGKVNYAYLKPKGDTVLMNVYNPKNINLTDVNTNKEANRHILFPSLSPTDILIPGKEKENITMLHMDPEKCGYKYSSGINPAEGYLFVYPHVSNNSIPPRIRKKRSVCC